MIGEVIGQEQASAEGKERLNKIDDMRYNVEFLSMRLDRLAKLEALLKGKYRKKLEDLLDQFNKADGYQGELKSLAKQLRKNKERQSVLKKQIADLEKHKKIISQTMKQVAGYEKSSGEQVEAIEEEHEVLCQRVHDLMQMLELAAQAELNGKEMEIVCQRVYATKELLEEYEMDLRKRVIDLLFECYIPPRNGVAGR